MTGLSPEIVLGIADVLVFFGVIALISLLLVSRNAAAVMPAYGGKVVLAGIFLMAFIHLFGDSTIVRATDLGAFINSLLPEWFFWVASRSAMLMITVGFLIAYQQRQRVDSAIKESQDRTSAFEERLHSSEARFRGLLETTTNAVWCYAFDPPLKTNLPVDAQVDASLDAVLADRNHIFVEQLALECAAGEDATLMGSRGMARQANIYRSFFATFVRAGYRVANYDMNFESAAGVQYAVRISMTGIVKKGYLHRIWGMETDVLDAQRTREALQRRHSFDELIARISTRLVISPFTRADAVVEESLREAAVFFGANRGSLIWANWDDKVGDILFSWSDGRGSTLPKRIVLEQIPFFANLLVTGDAMRIDNLQYPPDGLEVDVRFLANLGIRSMMFQPLIVEGNVLGAVTLANDRELRSWSDQDIVDLRVVTELIGAFTLRMRQARTLDSALANLRSASERLEAENLYLRNEIKLTHDFEEIIGESATLKQALQLVEQVANTPMPVLILGETGTGKELIARALHEHSRRCNRPLVRVNCATLPANLVESELFGYEKGAFTGATGSKRGRFDLAHGSTLFLDEIGEIPIDLQPKLLRVLQEGEFERLGGTETIKVEVRIVAATNRDMWQAVADGEFRADLLYRINTFPIELPALRDRGDDIRLLAEYFTQLHAKRLGREVTQISAEMIRELEGYDWPGNVRELEGVIERALISCQGPILELGRPLTTNANGSPASGAAAPDLRSVEREHIAAVLEVTNWKISGDAGAAAKLGVPPSTLRSKMKKLGVQRPGP